jgi:hypothetical protein
MLSGQAVRRLRRINFSGEEAMPFQPTRREATLFGVCAVLLLAAWFGPVVGQPADHHHFADTRTLLGVPFCMDVLSNLAFALSALAGARVLWRLPAGKLLPAQRQAAWLFFGGLLATAVASSYYHLAPSDAGLAVDRLGMVLAFAGLLGLAVADRVSDRAGRTVIVAVLGLGPASVALWSATGNVLPWAVLQFGGLLVLASLCMWRAVPGALGVRLGAVIGLYAVAKAFELGDHAVFDFSHGMVSGHTMKHLVAACAAWPVLAALERAADGARAQTAQSMEQSTAAPAPATASRSRAGV